MDHWLLQGAIIGKVGKWVEVFWGDPEFEDKEKKLSKTTVYRTSFFREEPKPWVIFPKSQRFEWKEWRDFIQQHVPPVSTSLPPLLWQEPSKDDFKKTFNDIRKQITAGKIIKAVPLVYSKAPKARPLDVALAHALKQSPKNTYIYGYWTAHDGFFGFTPEILFFCEEDRKIKTMALAGTRRAEAFAQDPEEFQRDPKEMREHQIVIDDIVERLKTAGKVRVGRTATLELNYLAHLYTPIQLTGVEPLTFQQLVELLHPTAALGVSPRDQLQLLRDWRDANDRLGAPFGVRWDAEHFLSVVAIRQVSWDENFYYIGNGCGIVAESNLEDEWQELKMKRESVRKMFRL
jgi:menaquinone-specific isochorismate synthase